MSMQPHSETVYDPCGCWSTFQSGAAAPELATAFGCCDKHKPLPEGFRDALNLKGLAARLLPWAKVGDHVTQIPPSTPL
jgi:hypothetical protein